MLTSSRLLVFAISLSVFIGHDVSAQSANNDVKLLALVIGNSAYQDRYLGGPANDAVDMAKALTSIGFKVTNPKRTDLTLEEMNDAVLDFSSKADSKTVAVVYYSGHGMEDDRKNYLVPVDAKVEKFSDIQRNLVALDWMLDQLDKRRVRAKIVILDACRSLPLALRYKKMGESGGLARLTQIVEGTRVIYAASPGKVSYAAQAGARNSIFTAALLQAVNEKFTTFDDILNRAAALTLEATGNRQFPWSDGNIGMTFEARLKAQSNPLMQEQKNVVPALTNARSTPPPGRECKEISEQVFENGIAVWRKVCA